jgi:hypothetical protein
VIFNNTRKQGLEEAIRALCNANHRKQNGQIDAMRKSIVSVALFILAISSWTPTFGEIYEYKNAAGRTVRSLSPPPDAKISSDTESSNERSAGEFCRDKWGKNFEMREYCMDNQRKARRQLSGYPADVLEFCKQKWRDNYQMIEYCARNQSAAKRRLGE